MYLFLLGFEILSALGFRYFFLQKTFSINCYLTRHKSWEYLCCNVFFDHRTEIFKALSDGPSLGIELSVQSRVIFAIDSFFIGQMFPCA